MSASIVKEQLREVQAYVEFLEERVLDLQKKNELLVEQNSNLLQQLFTETFRK